MPRLKNQAHGAVDFVQLAALDETLYNRFRPDTSSYPAIERMVVKSEANWRRDGNTCHWTSWRLRNLPLGSSILIEQVVSFGGAPTLKSRRIGYMPTRFFARLCPIEDETRYLGLPAQNPANGEVPDSSVDRQLLPILGMEKAPAQQLALPGSDGYATVLAELKYAEVSTRQESV